MENTDITHEELVADLDEYLQELATYYSEYQLQPGEFTVNDVVERAVTPVNRKQVLTGLQEREKRGELNSKLVKINGSRQFVFWKSKNPAD